MPANLTPLIILLVGVLILVLNNTFLNGQIPEWFFVLILMIWLIVRIRTFRNREK